MQKWLYEKDRGYYSKLQTIGKKGDFYTAVSSSAFFGASIANFFYKEIQKNNFKANAWLIEVGAHQGYLICDMIQWLYTCNSNLIKSLKFGIIEKSLDLQKEQKKYIQDRFGDDVKISFFQSFSEISDKYAFIVANEIFDAFPVELFKEKQIAFIENHKIKWINAPKDILSYSQKYNLSKGEIAIGYEEFSKEIRKSFAKCDFVTFDYGERYIRNDFSIRVYKEHKVFPFFDENIKLEDLYQNSDITYDVNFEYLINSFLKYGFKLNSYETQAKALINFGIIDILEEFKKQTKDVNYISEVNKIKTLLSPTIMGDRFKMLSLYI